MGDAASRSGGGAPLVASQPRAVCAARAPSAQFQRSAVQNNDVVLLSGVVQIPSQQQGRQGQQQQVRVFATCVTTDRRGNIARFALTTRVSEATPLRIERTRLGAEHTAAAPGAAAPGTTSSIAGITGLEELIPQRPQRSRNALLHGDQIRLRIVTSRQQQRKRGACQPNRVLAFDQRANALTTTSNANAASTRFTINVQDFGALSADVVYGFPFSLARPNQIVQIGNRNVVVTAFDFRCLDGGVLFRPISPATPVPGSPTSGAPTSGAPTSGGGSGGGGGGDELLPVPGTPVPGTPVPGPLVPPPDPRNNPFLPPPQSTPLPGPLDPRNNPFLPPGTPVPAPLDPSPQPPVPNRPTNTSKRNGDNTTVTGSVPSTVSLNAEAAELLRRQLAAAGLGTVVADAPASSTLADGDEEAGGLSVWAWVGIAIAALALLALVAGLIYYFVAKKNKQETSNVASQTTRTSSRSNGGGNVAATRRNSSGFQRSVASESSPTTGLADTTIF